MGRKKRLSHIIRKWIKSDLPDERSTVLLLGVTRIPTTPTVARRPCSLPLDSNHVHQPHNPIILPKPRKPSVSARRNYLKDSKLNRRVVFDSNEFDNTASASTNSSTSTSSKQCSISDNDENNPNLTSSSTSGPCPTMDRSVDSIGACSLDIDASVELSDWSEQSSAGTLRSASFNTPPESLPHLPSYLSLACTVSGYSTTTNYDPERLARSRDASPHRLHDDLTQQNRASPVYNIRNNLLSPPNLVPLPNHRYTLVNLTPETPKNMENQVLSRHEYYSSSSTKTTTFMSENKRFVNGMFPDTVDGCIENGHQRCVSYETKSYVRNGTSKTISETSSYKEFSNGIEKKSFIQQRVERLYGPGALAHGFFVSRRQKDRLSESESQHTDTNGVENNSHSKSMTDNILVEMETVENNIRQSVSNPVLPVLRHLRPEFRAQLPIINSKKPQYTNSKSSVIKEDSNCCNGGLEDIKNVDVKINDNQIVIGNGETINDTCAKDGHYFLEIIENQSRRLLELADRVEKEEAELHDLSEENKGKLRAASGKARLLTSQKMQQFKGLCTKNITQSPSEAFPTTSEDLQGFWDMVLLQVDQVDALFREIDTLRQNGWKDPNPVNLAAKPSNTNNRKQPRKIKSATATNGTVHEDVRKAKEAQRKKMIEERRKAMRDSVKPADSIEFFVSETS